MGLECHFFHRIEVKVCGSSLTGTDGPVKWLTRNCQNARRFWGDLNAADGPPPDVVTATCGRPIRRRQKMTICCHPPLRRVKAIDKNNGTWWPAQVCRPLKIICSPSSLTDFYDFFYQNHYKTSHRLERIETNNQMWKAGCSPFARPPAVNKQSRKTIKINCLAF